MADLEGKTIAATYRSVLNVGTANNQELDGTPRVIADGAGNASLLFLSTDSVLISGSGTRLDFNTDGSGEYISGDGTDLTIAAGTALNITADIIDLSDAAKDITLYNAVDALNFDSNTLSIDASNNRIGIGTSSPAGKLSIETIPDDTTGLWIDSSTANLSGGTGLAVITNNHASTTDALLRVHQESGSATASGDLIRATITSGNTDVFNVKNDGKVGIGTASPTNNLDVAGVSATTCRVTSSAIADGTGTGFTVQGLANGEDTEHTTQMGLYVYNSDITDPVSFIRLDSQDSIVHYMWFDDNDALHWSPTVGHIGTTNGTAVFDQTSDERLKDISSDAFPYGLDAVNRITPIQYKFKKDKDKINKLGFGAQTIQDIVPEVVKDTGECLDGYNEIRTEDGQSTFTPKGEIEGNTKLVMEYQQIIPVLVKAIQELSAKVEALENA